jgi:hypothetical protein
MGVMGETATWVMHDEIAVRVGDGIADLNKELQALLDIGLSLFAVLGDGKPLDIFHHHEGPAVGRNSAVIEPRDAGMIQAGQDLTLGLKPLQLGRGFALQQFDGNPLVEICVRAGGLVNLAHAAATDEPLDGPRPKPHADGRVRHHVIGRGTVRGCTEKSPGGVSGTQETLHLGKDGRRLIMPATQLRYASFLGQVE